MQIIALIAPTASGKSALALRLAQALDAEIFSIDALSIYKEVNIASAKPSAQDLRAIKHYGIDILRPDEHSNAEIFRTLLRDALKHCHKPFLLIVGGSGFYLSAFCEGLSAMPPLTPQEASSIAKRINLLSNPYAFLEHIDATSASRINKHDTYRINKLLTLYFATQTPPSIYFATHAKSPIIKPPPTYTITMPKEALHERIHTRTQHMLEQGLLHEARTLLARYGEGIQPFSAIGLKECLAYLTQSSSTHTNNLNHLKAHTPKPHTKEALSTLISIHTRQLAKRQATYIRAKFPNAYGASSDSLYDLILRTYRA